jgi:hypothetical protein
LLLDVLVGASFCLLGLANWRRPSLLTSLLMIGTGISWLIGGLAPVAVLAHRGPLIHLLLSYPRNRLRACTERLVVAAGYVDGVLLPVGHVDALTVALCAAAIGVSIRGYLGSYGIERRARLPAVIAAIAVLGTLGVAALLRLLGHPHDRASLIGYDCVMLATAAALSIDTRWGRWGSAAIASLVLDLGDTGPGGSLRAELARALGDPLLTIGFVVPPDGDLVDESGHPLETSALPTSRVVTAIRQDGVQIAALVHDALVLDDPALLDSVTALTKLAIGNVQLQAEVRARVAELDASRRRILAAASTERARLETELRAGALRSLEEVDDSLSACGAPAAGLRAQLGEARTGLRTFARGVYPSLLTESGLAAALAELASTATFPVELAIADARWHADLEAAAYFVCSEAMANIEKHAAASRCLIRIAEDDAGMCIEVSDNGRGGADPAGGSGLVGLADRLSVLGGTMIVSSPPGGGTRLLARIPLICQ